MNKTEHKEKNRLFWKKYWAVIWLFTAIVCAISLIAYAEFDTNKNKVKRVAANVSSGGQMFSSDYLDKTTTVQRIPFSAGTNGYCPITVKIWNYSKSNPSKAYQGDLPYTWNAPLVKRVVISGTNGNPDTIEYQPISQEDLGNLVIKFGDASFTWNVEESAYTMSGSRTFTATSGDYVPNEHEYTISFPESMLSSGDNIYVKLEAVPINGDISLSAISGVFGIQTGGTSLTQGWTGYFSDNKTYADYDAFNYVFTGNGSATFTFQWCTNYLEVSQISLDAYGLTATSSNITINGVQGTWKTVTINANANTGVNRYDFQLYMTADPTKDYKAQNKTFWETVESYVNNSLPKQ